MLSKKESDWNCWYPIRAIDLRATRLSVSISSINASVANDQSFKSHSLTAKQTSRNIIQLRPDISKNHNFHVMPVKVGLEIMHEVYFLDVMVSRLCQIDRY